jgi:hypothetical protein
VEPRPTCGMSGFLDYILDRVLRLLQVMKAQAAPEGMNYDRRHAIQSASQVLHLESITQHIFELLYFPQLIAHDA